jgi:amino acid transporter
VAELAASDAPLLEVVRRAAPKIPPWTFATIALFAVANTGLLNFIMASRLLYGMAQQRLLPSWLGHVHTTTRTPHWAIATIFAAALTLAVSGTIVYLAGTTSVLLLLVFASVNLALIAVKRRGAGEHHGFKVPMLVPITGASASVVLIGFLPRTSLLTATILIAAGLAVAVTQTIRRRTEAGI